MKDLKMVLFRETLLRVKNAEKLVGRKDDKEHKWCLEELEAAMALFEVIRKAGMEEEFGEWCKVQQAVILEA